ncbi:hypothetical protein ZIOFF_014525 [Zingiber officinale]|uniref:Uncharacterized protein n=1 Tax=Zingiber officinale TaxID=94328 RepID=A0A8J5HHF3_ZINOF|nr:hypothetical protein ZIOFF_014525 [Zingiber officinale]
MESNSRAASSSSSFLLLIFLFASLPCWKLAAAAAAASPGRWTAACNETEGGGHRCSSVEKDLEEFQFDSEINRRLLAGSGSSDVVHQALDASQAVCHTKRGSPSQCGGLSGNKPGPQRNCGTNLYRCPP